MTDIERLACSRSYMQNIIKLGEEMGELMQAVSKCYENETPAARQSVVEEMADVLICIDLMRCLLRIDDGRLTDMRHHKMQRNMLRIRGKETDYGEGIPAKN